MFLSTDSGCSKTAFICHLCWRATVGAGCPGFSGPPSLTRGCHGPLAQKGGHPAPRALTPDSCEIWARSACGYLGILGAVWQKACEDSAAERREVNGSTGAVEQWGQGWRGHSALFPSTLPFPLCRRCRREEEQWLGKFSRWFEHQPAPRRSSAWLWGAALAMSDLCSWQVVMAVWDVVSAFSTSCSASPGPAEGRGGRAGASGLWAVAVSMSRPFLSYLSLAERGQWGWRTFGPIPLNHTSLIYFNLLSNLKPLSGNCELSDIEMKLKRERERKKKNLEQ